MNTRHLVQEYWNYYLEIENQFYKSRRYISFDQENYFAYSAEYIQLIQAICSEIDVVGKVIAQLSNSSFQVNNRTNITKWGYEVQKAFVDLDLKTIYFDNTLEITPFKKWKYKEGGKNHPIVYVDSTYGTPSWWLDYNKIKHERTSIDNEIVNFRKAHLKNVIYSLGALYILEMFLLKTYGGINLETDTIRSIKKSKLFQYSITEVEMNNQIKTN